MTATSQAILKVMPPGINPPYIVQYSATSVPIVQIAVSSDTLTEQQIFDYASNFIIQRLGTVQGARVPQPWGGKWPQVMVDLDPDQLYARGLSPQDVQTAINNQNLIVPAGTAKIGDTEYYVKLNSSPDLIAAFNDMPVKTVNGVPIYVKDVAHVRMGYMVQTNVVRRDGRRAVLMTILKGEGASSLDVVNRVRAAMPGIQAQMPPELKMELLFDQSVFVRAAVEGVIKEGAIAAGLTALMILLFLGSWRSTLIVAVSIPLSILTSIIVLWALGQSLNTMTLGGLALAVGILVDDATVELENIHRNFGAEQADPPGDPRRGVADRHAGVRLDPGHLHRLRAGAVPDRAGGLALLSAGAGGRLRHARLVLPVAHPGADDGALHAAEGSPAVHRGGAGSAAVRRRADLAVPPALQPPVRALARRLSGAARLGAGAPLRDAGGDARLRPRLAGAGPLARRGLLPRGRCRPVPAARPGAVRHAHRGDRARLRPGRGRDPRDRARRTSATMILDNMGLTPSFTTRAYIDNGTVSDGDGEILVSLKPEHRPTAAYVARLREELPKRFPDCTFYFQPADITSQILDFGLPAPINVQVVGVNREGNLAVAKKLRQEMAKIPGIADVHIHQITDQPDAPGGRGPRHGLGTGADPAERDRQRAGVAQRHHPGDAQLLGQPPEPRQLRAGRADAAGPHPTVDALMSTPIINVSSGQSPAGDNLARSSPGRRAEAQQGPIQQTPAAEQPVAPAPHGLGGGREPLQRAAGVRGLRGRAGARPGRRVGRRAARRRLDASRSCRAAAPFAIRGQVESMNSSFTGLAFGLLFAVLLVYFLMVVNFQSWLDPFIILTALPGALAGICGCCS